MPTPTLDHQDQPPEPCGCSLYRLCTPCFARAQKAAAERGLRDWLASYGTRENRAGRQRPVLRVVR